MPLNKNTADTVYKTVKSYYHKPMNEIAFWLLFYAGGWTFIVALLLLAVSPILMLREYARFGFWYARCCFGEYGPFDDQEEL